MAKFLKVKKTGTKHELDMSTEVKELQAMDPTLSDVRQTAKATKIDDSEEEIGVFYRDNLLFKRWIPTRFQKMNREERSMAVYRAVGVAKEVQKESTRNGP